MRPISWHRPRSPGPPGPPCRTSTSKDARPILSPSPPTAPCSSPSTRRMAVCPCSTSPIRPAPPHCSSRKSRSASSPSRSVPAAMMKSGSSTKFLTASPSSISPGAWWWRPCAPPTSRPMSSLRALKPSSPVPGIIRSVSSMPPPAPRPQSSRWREITHARLPLAPTATSSTRPACFPAIRPPSSPPPRPLLLPLPPTPRCPPRQKPP